MNTLSIYQEKILSLAAENKKVIALKDFNRSFEMRNPMCGDEVKVRLKLVETKIIDISVNGDLVLNINNKQKSFSHGSLSLLTD